MNIEDGYGEFVVVNVRGAPIHRDTHDRAYKIFIDNRDQLNRKELINSQLKVINPDLCAVFIPRTLYDLTVCQELIERGRPAPDPDYREMKKRENKWRQVIAQKSEYGVQCLELAKKAIREEMERSQPQNHLSSPPNIRFEDAGDNFDPQVVKLAYITNQLFEKRIEGGVLTGEMVAALLEEKIEFLANYCDQPGVSIGTVGSFFKPSLQGEIKTELRKQVIRKQTALECSEIAKNAFLLIRGSVLKNDRPDYNLSYGTSLFAGAGNDPTAVVFYYIGNRYRERNNGYTLVVPKEEADQSPFYIPRTHALCQLFGVGEAFHAATKTPENKHYSRRDAGLSIPLAIANLKSTMSSSELEQKFQRYKSQAVVLT